MNCFFFRVVVGLDENADVDISVHFGFGGVLCVRSATTRTTCVWERINTYQIVGGHAQAKYFIFCTKRLRKYM